MGDSVRQWTSLVHGLYPRDTAADWDNVGLQVGDPEWPVERVLVGLDVTSAVLDEAVSRDAGLVLAHHPVLFRPLHRLTPSSAPGRIALAAASRRIAVLAAHTNLDVATDGAGTSDPVADVLDLHDRRPLVDDVVDSGLVKLVTFVPVEDTDAVLDAVANAGGGVIGNYDRCSFRTRGTGTFRPLDGAHPYRGAVGDFHRGTEDRLEIDVPRRRLAAVVGALMEAHPYEEVAYDLYPRVQASAGFGRVGHLARPAPLRDVAERIRTRLPAPHLRFAGPGDRPIRTVAVVGGAGDSLIGAALAAGVDCYVTGDLRHHVTLDALEEGLTLIDAGHHATESAAIPLWIERLRQAASHRGLSAQVLPSEVVTVPWSS